MQPSKHRALAAAVFAVLGAGAPRAGTGADELEKPPLGVPLFDGSPQRTHQAPQGELQRPLIPDYRRLYDMVVECWPAKSWFRGELYAEGRLSTRTDTNAVTAIDTTTGSVTQRGDRYIALVARIPLISATELDKERSREAERHGKIADAVGELVASFSERVMSTRQLGLARALEKRAQERVRAGVAETSEQVRYLEQVSSLEGKIATLQASEIKAKLHIIGMCDERRMTVIDAYLDNFNRVR